MIDLKAIQERAKRGRMFSHTQSLGAALEMVRELHEVIDPLCDEVEMLRKVLMNAREIISFVEPRHPQLVTVLRNVLAEIDAALGGNNV